MTRDDPRGPRVRTSATWFSRTLRTGLCLGLVSDIVHEHPLSPYTIYIYKHDHSLLVPRVAESLSTKARNSYLQLPLGAPTLCSLAKPTGTESPPVSPEATSAKPDVPQARILMRGKPSFDSLQSRNVVSLISHPREIEPRIRKK